MPPGWSHYTPSDGIVELREMVASLYPGYDFSDVLIVPGLKQGLYYFMNAIAKSRILVPEPSWLGYQAIAGLTGNTFIPINRYKEDWINALRNTPFDALVLCSPNNPDGYVISEMEADRLMEICQKKNAFLLVDEIYFAFQFESRVNPFRKWFGHELLVIGGGLSKSHAMTGFRIGYLLMRSESVRKRVSLLQQNIITCAPAVSQYLALGALDAKDEVDGFREYYKVNRNLVVDSFPGNQQVRPAGGFYFFLDMAEWGVRDSNAFCLDLLDKKQVALVPGSAYGTGFDSFARISYSVDREELAIAISLLKAHLSNRMS